MKKNRTGDKIFRFLCSGVVGISFERIIEYCYQTDHWELFWLSLLIVALGFSILVCVWGLIDWEKGSK